MEKISPKMYEQLKAPLPSEAISPHPTKTYLSSIKAIYVTERLNDVFWCGSWTTKVEVVEKWEKGMVVVKVIFEVPEYWIYYESFGWNDNGGEGSKNFDLWDAYKGATTDAITKIGSFMGIAIDVFKGKGKTQWNNAPRTSETPTQGTKWKTLAEYIEEIRQEKDTNHIKFLQDEAKSGKLSEKQIAWIDKEVESRLHIIKNLPF